MLSILRRLTNCPIWLLALIGPGGMCLLWSMPTALPLVNLWLLLPCVICLSQLQRRLDREASVSRIQSDKFAASLLHATLPVLAESAEVCDPVLRSVFNQRYRTALQGLNEILSGTVTFPSTEQWRSLYEQLLTLPGVHRYRSVAVLRNESYWQGEAGRKSMELNFHLSERKAIVVERIVILTDGLWPHPDRLPVPPIQEWLIEQHHHNIVLWLVRESEVRTELDLVIDVGIYGNRAVGRQLVDDAGETKQFTLRFGLQYVEAAEEKWKRLMVYAVKYSDFLDRYSVSS